MSCDKRLISDPRKGGSDRESMSIPMEGHSNLGQEDF